MTTNSFFAVHKSSKFEPFEIEGIDGAKIKHLTASEKAEKWESWWRKSDGQPHKSRYAKRFGRLIQLCIYDKDGNQVFAESDIENLMEIDAKEFERIAEKCLEVNTFLDSEETEKN